MSTLIRYSLLLTFAGLIFASASCTATSVQNKMSTEKDGLEYSLETDKHSYRLGEDVGISFRVKNKTDQVKELGTIINCEYCMCQLQITMNDEDVWRNCRVPPPCGQKVFLLSPGESWEYAAVWKMIHDNGTLEPEDDFPVSPGKYRVTGELLGEKVFVLIEIK
jgi:hypothetical protein